MSSASGSPSKGSPSKGKAKEDESWQLGWWGLQPLLEPEDRPVAWSRTGVIFTAHATQPYVLGRLFPSTKQFRLQPPPLIQNNPLAYEPPTVISISPSISPKTQLLFAYFPSRNQAGICCLWKAGAELDTWNDPESWECARGGGIVASTWLGQPREWATDSSGGPVRLPPLGPSTPVAVSTLLLVTQNMETAVHFIRHGTNATSGHLTCSLSFPDEAKEREQAQGTAVEGEYGVKACSKAVIGLGYDESSIIIATHSRLVPRPPTIPAFNEMDLAMSMDMQPALSMSTSYQGDDWENWTDEPAIELCEIRLGLDFDSVNMTLSTHPLPPLRCQPGHLSKLAFVPRNRPNDASTKNTCAMHLLTSYLDFDNDLCTPTSDLLVYSLTKNEHAQNNSQPSWLTSKVSSRESTSAIPTFISSRWLGSPSDTILMGTVDASIHIPRRRLRPREHSIGRISVIQIPSLEVDDKWKTLPVYLNSADNVLPDIPFNAAISPNGDLICTVSSPQLSPLRISIRPLSRQTSDGLFGASPGDQSPSYLKQEASRILTAMRSGGSLSDVIHRLSLPSHPLSELQDLLRELALLIKQEDTNSSRSALKDVVGFFLEAYRTRARNTSSPEQDELSVRWRTAQDICSIIACHSAFEEYKDGDLFNLKVVWPLVGLSTWFINFLEDMMKDCVFWSDRSSAPSVPPPPQSPIDDLFGAASPATSSSTTIPLPAVFLHLIHPFTLRNLRTALADVKGFYDQLIKLNPGAENVQIAKSTFLDVVSSSGINLKELDSVLAHIPDEIKHFDAKELQNSLSLCRPSQASFSLVDTIVTKLISSGAIDKPRLFIKATDLVIGVGKLHVSDDGKDNNRDIVSKGLLPRRDQKRVCQRCGGKSDLSAREHAPSGWLLWENKWSARCICGGYWATRAPQNFGM